MKLDVDIKNLPPIVQFSVLAIVINLAMITLAVPMLEDMREEAIQQNSVPLRQITEARRRLENIAREKSFIREKLPTYERIAESGFFNTQDRLSMAGRLEEIGRAFLVSLDYSFLKEENQPLVGAEEGGGRNHLAVTPIELRMEAHTDVEIHRFIGRAIEMFPGYLAVHDLAIERSKTRLTTQTLKEIAQGKGQPMVSATATLRWQTLRAKEEKKD